MLLCAAACDVMPAWHERCECGVRLVSGRKVSQVGRDQYVRICPACVALARAKVRLEMQRATWAVMNSPPLWSCLAR